MINLWFLWFLQECHRNCWELKLAIGHFRQPRLENRAGAVWTWIELCLTLAWVNIEARSEPVGVQGSRLYDQAGHPTTHSSWCSLALAADAKSFRAPAILFASEAVGWCRWWRGNHSSDSQPNAIALHLGFPIHKGASFLFLHVKVWFVITKTLLATEREQPKPASIAKCTLDTKKQ